MIFNKGFVIYTKNTFNRFKLIQFFCIIGIVIHSGCYKNHYTPISTTSKWRNSLHTTNKTKSSNDTLIIKASTIDLTQEVKKLRKNKNIPLTILLQEGTHYLRSPLTLTQSDISIVGAGPSKTKIIIDIPRSYKSNGAISISGAISSKEIPLSHVPKYMTNHIQLQKSTTLKSGDYLCIYSTPYKPMPLKSQSNIFYSGMYDINRIQYNWGKDYKKGHPQQSLPIIKQMFKISETSNNLIVLDMYHGISYDSLQPTYIKQINPIKNIQLSDFSIEWSYNWLYTPTEFRGTHTQGIWDNHIKSNIYVEDAVDCQISNIISTKAHISHITLSRSKSCRIQSTTARQLEHLGFQTEWAALLYGGKARNKKRVTARGYGINIENGSTENLITNCTFYNLRRGISITSGSNHNIISYNSFAQGEGAENSICFHGNYPHNNLIEGNILDNGSADYIHSSNGPGNTWFRNYTVTNKNTKDLMNEYIGVYSSPLQKMSISHSANKQQNIVGNVLGQIAQDGEDLTVHSNVILSGFLESPSPKMVNLNIQDIYVQESSNTPLPPSLYLKEKPPFLPESTPWPLWGPDVRDYGIYNTLPSTPFEILVVETQGATDF